MKTIWKYNFEMSNRKIGALGSMVSWKEIYEIMIPKNGDVLAIRTQHDKPAMWVQVDPEEPKEIRKFIIVGTGHSIPDGTKSYLGMFFLNSGNYVGHIYEVE